MVEKDFIGKTVVVTEGAGIIGKAIGTAFAGEGARVAVCDRNLDAARDAARALRASSADAEGFQVDLGRRGDLAANYNIDLNLNGGTVYLTRLVLPHMIAQGGGSIIFTSSVCGVTGLRLQCGFVASKFAICALTRSLALEYAKYNIRVNTLAPGSLPSPDAKRNFLWDTCDFEDFDKNFEDPTTILYDIPARRPAYPSDMAGIILYFASDDALYTTGQVVCVDGGWTAGLSGNY